ncbi:MAG: hypothetical protein UHK60_09090 [Acutalibacteraceae bacterium]|nr:hypothetical protein [Acutalibacteraceae bacterium]
MNNPIDIGRMYGLNNTNTRTINPQDTVYMLNNANKLPQRETSPNTDDMGMSMQGENMNITDEMPYNSDCGMKQQNYDNNRNMYSSKNKKSNVNNMKMHSNMSANTNQNMWQSTWGNMHSQMQNNSQLMPINSNISAHSVTPNIIYQGSTHNHNIEYMNELMRTQVGKMADVEFLVGTNNTHVKRGQITGVGTNYIVIREYDTGRTMVGDFSDIKFVTIYDDYH